ncbi:periplasmic binding protein domain-containing protein [Ditylenchus destructor]|uniref:Periplasmic binding protein domain-containing protein n=1 Tax=Ditylenchus destructor TaxID=166010 RepID=A0AAD4MG75_9BILA|nr:periplasmic binding protein domain-containing protein [Ditylenchus destructor]
MRKYLEARGRGVTLEEMIAAVGSPDVRGAVGEGEDAGALRAGIRIAPDRSAGLPHDAAGGGPRRRRRNGRPERHAAAHLRTFIRNTDPGSNASLPGATIPLALANNLPVGLALDGPIDSDRRLLAIAEAVHPRLRLPLNSQRPTEIPKEHSMDRRHFLQATLAAGAASALPTAFAADPLKVAVMIPQSGPGGLFGPSCKACAEMAATALNARGGVLGRKIELLYGDAGLAPAEAGQAALKLWKGQKAGAVIGMHDSAVRGALVGLFKGQVPYFYTPVYEGGECAKGTYVKGETPQQQLEPVIPWLAAERKPTKWYMIGNDYIWGRNTNATARAYIEKTGAKVVGDEYLPFTVDNFDASLARIRDSGADAVLVSLVGGASVTFNKSFRELRPFGQGDSPGHADRREHAGRHRLRQRAQSLFELRLLREHRHARGEGLRRGLCQGQRRERAGIERPCRIDLRRLPDARGAREEGRQPGAGEARCRLRRNDLQRSEGRGDRQGAPRGAGHLRGRRHGQGLPRGEDLPEGRRGTDVQGLNMLDGNTLLHGLNLAYELATLALTTLGLAIVFGLLGVMNMAHGEFVMLGAYSVVTVQKLGLPLVAAVPLRWWCAARSDTWWSAGSYGRSIRGPSTRCSRPGRWPCS